jgi:hypothetical protein
MSNTKATRAIIAAGGRPSGKLHTLMESWQSGGMVRNMEKVTGIGGLFVEYSWLCQSWKEVGNKKSVCGPASRIPCADLASFLQGSFIPYNMPVYPGALRVADNPGVVEM